MPTADAVNPQSDRLRARIAGAVMGTCLACIGALIGGYGDWVSNALEGAIACGITGALLGPVITASPRTSRKVLIIALAGLLACTAGTANLVRNAGWWGISDVFIQARLDPMASPTFDGYRLCSRNQVSGDFLGDHQSLILRFDIGSVRQEKAVARAAEKATEHGWTGTYRAGDTWIGHKPRLLAFPGTTLTLTISAAEPLRLPIPGVDASCDVSIDIGTLKLREISSCINVMTTRRQYAQQ